MKRHLIFSLAIMLSAFAASAQQKVKDGTVANGNLPNKDAILELESSSKGLLYSRVALKSTTNASPLSAHIAGMMIYNTQTIADVVPGIYYNDGTKWILAGAGDGAAANIKYNPATYILSYLDASNNPVSINLKNVVKENETLTTLVNNNGTYKYTSENGTITLINVPADVINNFQTIANDNTVKQIIENIVKTSGGNVSYDGTNFTYVDNTGKTQTINIDQLVKAHETITTLVDNKNGTYTYTSENGKTTLINVPADVINNFQTIANDNTVKQIIENIVKNTGGNVSYDGANFTYVDNTGKTQTINIDQLVKAHETITTLVDNKNGTYTYTAEDGKTTLINVPADVINNFQTIANDNTVKQIIENIVKNTGGNVSYDGANFTYVDNTGKTQTINIDQLVKAHETITTLVDNKNGTYTYTAEDGKTTLINVPTDVINNFQTIANDNTVKQIIENIVKNTGGNVSYDGANFTYVDNTGKTQTINIDQLVKAHETITTLVDNKNGTYTYTAEDGKTTLINVPADVINNFQTIANDNTVKQIIENIVKNTGGNVSYDGTSFTYVDNTGKTQTINIDQLVKAHETITTLVDNKNGTYTYTNEKNEAVNINVIGDAVTNITNKGDLYTTIKNLVNTEQTLTSLVYDATKNTLTYTDENKQSNVIDLGSLVTKNQLTTSVVDGTTTSATSTIAGNNTAYKVEVKDGAITTDKLANNAVTTDKINNQSVTANKLTAAATDEGKVATVNADGTVSYKSVSVSNATDGKDLSAASDKVTVAGGTGALLKAASVDVNESKLSLQNIGGLLNANQVAGGTAGDVFVVGTDGKGSWVSKANATSVSNTLTGTSLTTTVNGTTGVAVDLKGAIQSAQKTTVVAAGTGTTVATATANDVTTYTVSADLANISLAGDVTGAANATKVEKIQGTAVSATAPTANQVLTYDATTKSWIGATPTVSATNVTGSGNLTSDQITFNDGTGATLKNVKATINDKSITAAMLNSTGATNGQVAIANGTGGVSYGNLPASSVTGADVTAASNKVILAGTPTGAALKAFSVDVDETKLNLNASQIKGGTAGQVMVVGAGNTGSWVDQSTLVPATTVSNTSTVNDLTTKVNGVTANPVKIINSNDLSLNAANKLVTTVNGVASTTALDLTPAIQAGQKTSSVISGTTTTVTSAASAGNANNTEYKVEVKDAAIQAGQLKTTLSNGTNTTVASTVSGNTTDYNVSVNNATATTTGAVKPGTGLSIDAATGTISVNPATLTSGKGITTDGIIQVNGGTTLANSVLADATLTIKDKSITAAKLDATGATAGQVATVNADGTVSYKSVSVSNATDGKDLSAASDKVTVAGGTGALLKAASVDVNESKLSLQNIGGLLNANQVAGGTAGDVFVVGTDGKGSWVSKANATSVSNTLTGTSLTTTVNGTTGVAVDLKGAIQSAQKTTVVAAGTGTTVATATANDVTTYTVSADLANISLAGDVTGAANATKVEKIQGTAVSATAPTANQVLTYDATTKSWIGATPTVSATNVTGSGNLTSDQITFNDGTGATLKNVKATINDKSITAAMLNSTGATNGQVAIANGTGGVSYGNLPASSVTGADVTAASNKVILAGTPTGAALKAFSVDVDETKLNLNASQIKGGTAGQVMVVGAGNTGSWVDQSTLVPATTVSNTSTVNDLTTKVNGVTANPVKIINSNDLSLNAANKLVTTVNGVASTTALDLTPAIQAGQKTSSVISGTTTTVTSATSAGNANNTEYKVEVKDAAIQAGQLKTVLANGTNTTVGAPTVSGNTSTYKVDVATANGTALGVVKQGDGTVVVGADGALSVPASVITNAQKTTTVIAGTNTTVTPAAPNATGNTQYTVNVPTASGTALGVVKQGDGTVVVGTDGSLSVPATTITNAITANNGLNKSTANNIQLGGALTTATTIATGGSTTPANTLAISGLQPGATTDKIVVADPSTSVLKQVAAAMPKFFYMPSIIVPTAADQFVAESGITGESFGTINLYARYNKQFGTPAVSSAGAPALPVVAANQLYFYVTWYDTTVFSSVAVSAAGVLTYTVQPNADVTAGSFMNIVFAVK